MADIRSFTRDGTSHTQVDGDFPVIQPLTARDQLMALMDQERAVAPGARPQPVARRVLGTAAARPQRPLDPRTPAQNLDDDLRRMHAMDLAQRQMQASRDAEDAAIRGANTKPIHGLGYQGMQQKMSTMPQRLRPNNISLGPSLPPSLAGPSGPAPAQRMGPPDSGFDYLSAIDQARMLAAMQRGM